MHTSHGMVRIHPNVRVKTMNIKALAQPCIEAILLLKEDMYTQVWSTHNFYALHTLDVKLQLNFGVYAVHKYIMHARECTHLTFQASSQNFGVITVTGDDTRKESVDSYCIIYNEKFSPLPETKAKAVSVVRLFSFWWCPLLFLHVHGKNAVRMLYLVRRHTCWEMWVI